MKIAIKRISLLLVIVMLASFCLASCSALGELGIQDPNQNNNNNENKNPVTQSFELKAPKTTVTVGEEITLTAVMKNSEGVETAVENAEFIFVDGADYATIEGNVLTVKDNAPNGTIIQVKARDGATDSNVVTLVVKVDLTVSSIVIEALGSDKVVRGGSVGLHADVTPANAASLIEWAITEGSEYAEIKGSTLIVKEDAAVDSTVKVVAKSGEVVSNELTFTVTATKEEVNAAKYHVILSNSNIRLDKKGATAPVLTATVYNHNLQVVEDVELQFTVIKGSEFLGVKEDGFSCTFDALGHGEAEVEVRVKGTDATAKVKVDVIVPPDSIVLPEVFVERPTTDITKFNYAFSLVDPFTGNAESLPFAPTAKGSALACTELSYSFKHADGTTGDEVAVYENGAITFKKTGIVTVIVSSNSGSNVEARTEYKFDINNGYNVNSFEELTYVVEHNGYEGYNGEPINLVVLEKPVNNTGSGYEYGFDIVPSLALNTPIADQTVAQLVKGYTIYNGINVNLRVQAVNSSLYINGNFHTIDASQIKAFTKDEYNAYLAEYDLNSDNVLSNLSSLLSAEAWADKGPGTDAAVDGQTYMVNLYNLDLKGNVGFNYDPKAHGGSDHGVIGGYTHGISIGSRGYDVHYYIDANNLTSYSFGNGLAFTGIVGNGKITNLNVYDIYSTGLVVRSSIVNIENIKIGLCGATGIEMAPEECNEAGLNDNENSKVTISGVVDARTNLNNMASNYYNNYSIMGAPVSMIVQGNMAAYHANQLAHICNENGEYIFVSLLFYDLSQGMPIENTSVVDYAAFKQGGFTNLSDLPTEGTNTEDQFIKLDIFVDLPGLGNTKVGVAYFYNHNYVAPAAVAD